MHKSDSLKTVKNCLNVTATAKDKYSHILTVFSESVLMDDDYNLVLGPYISFNFFLLTTI